MQTLFDMLSNAQNGKGMDLLARQFNLSQQQAELAVEALLPAFSQGLKRNTADPYGLGSFLSALASGQHARYFEDAAQAFGPQGVQQGNDVLGQLFGSKDLSRAVAAQAAQATGIGQQVLQQMLPVIASMLMGGLLKQSTAPAAQAGGFGASDNPLGRILEQMMRQGGAQPASQPQAPQPNPFDPLGNNPFGKALQDMFGGAQQQTQQPQQDPFAGNPWGKILQDMMGGAAGGQAQQPRPSAQAPQAQPDAGEPQANPYDDIFGRMFETGRQQRDDYEKTMGSVFDQFLKGIDKAR